MEEQANYADASSATSPMHAQAATILDKMNRDMRFVGLFTIIQGALVSLSIIGALIGIPQIFAGLRIREAAKRFDRFGEAGDEAALWEAFEKQRTYFFINKVLIIVGLAVTVLYVVLLLGWVFYLFSSGQSTSF